MAKFAALLDFVEDLYQVEEARPKHREYLQALLEAGKLVMSGPWQDGTGALIVFETDGQGEAEALLRDDPYSRAGVLADARVREWRVVMSASSRG